LENGLVPWAPLQLSEQKNHPVVLASHRAGVTSMAAPHCVQVVACRPARRFGRGTGAVNEPLHAREQKKISVVLRLYWLGDREVTPPQQAQVTSIRCVLRGAVSPTLRHAIEQ
jgi:hypothetical protein